MPMGRVCAKSLCRIEASGTPPDESVGVPGPRVMDRLSEGLCPTATSRFTAGFDRSSQPLAVASCLQHYLYTRHAPPRRAHSQPNVTLGERRSH